MVMLAKIRRMHFRGGMSVREVSRRTGLSRDTVRRWLRQGAVEPVYPVRKRPCMIDAYCDQLELWFQTSGSGSLCKRPLWVGRSRLGQSDDRVCFVSKF